MTVAQEIIDEWLKDDIGVVKYGDGTAPLIPLAQNRTKTTNSRSKRSNSKAHDQLAQDSLLSTEWNGDSESTDYITGMDFVNTDISRCVEQVMAGMYTQPVEHDVWRMIESQQMTSNPAITMEMRHKQVWQRLLNILYYRTAGWYQFIRWHCRYVQPKVTHKQYYTAHMHYRKSTKLHGCKPLRISSLFRLLG